MKVSRRMISGSRLWQGRVQSATWHGFQKTVRWLRAGRELAQKQFRLVSFYWERSGLVQGLRQLEAGRQNLIAAYPLHPMLGKGIENITFLYCLFMPVLKDWAGVVLLLLIQWLFRPKPIGFSSFGQRLILLAVIIGTASVFSGGLIQGWEALYTVMTGLALAGFAARFFTPSRQEKLMRLFLWSAPMWLMIGFWQYAYSGRIPLGWLEPDQYHVIVVRLRSVFDNPNLYAMYLVVLLALVLELILRPGQLWQRLVYGLILAAGVWSLYWTYSRSGWLIGAMVLAWQGRNFWRRPAFMLLSLAVGVLAFQAGPGLARIAGFWQGTGTTLGYRFQIWQGVFRGIAEAWLWGAGPGGFSRVYPWHQVAAAWAVHAHQWLLQYWLEYGVFSLLALGSVFKWLYNSVRSAQASFWLIPITAFLGFGLVESWQVNSFINGLFWLMIGMAASYDKGYNENVECGDFWLLRPGKSGG